MRLDLHAMARRARPAGGSDPAASIAAAAELLEGLPDGELGDLHRALSATAGDLDEPGDVRRLAAQLAGAVDGARTGGLADWGALLAAGAQVNTIRNERAKG